MLGLLLTLAVAAAPVSQYRDRASGRTVAEPVYAEGALRWFYEDPLGRVAFGLLNNKPFNDLYGWTMDQPASVGLLPGYIERFHVDVSQAELPLGRYRSFNQFFARRLKPGLRPFSTDPRVFCSPCDGKVLVYPLLADTQRLPVKGARCALADLLGSEAEARGYALGAACVVRLAPADYHRFHFPDAGRAVTVRHLAGAYHSVFPIASDHVPDLLCRNKRDVSYLDSEHFGRLAMIEVGGITVGAIDQTYAPGAVLRGQEKGCFRNGGSTIVLLLPPGRLRFDEDLLAGTREGLEVTVHAGERLGVAATRGS